MCPQSHHLRLFTHCTDGLNSTLTERLHFADSLGCAVARLRRSWSARYLRDLRSVGDRPGIVWNSHFFLASVFASRFHAAHADGICAAHFHCVVASAKNGSIEGSSRLVGRRIDYDNCWCQFRTVRGGCCNASFAVSQKRDSGSQGRCGMYLMLYFGDLS